MEVILISGGIAFNHRFTHRFFLFPSTGVQLLDGGRGLLPPKSPCAGQVLVCSMALSLVIDRCLMLSKIVIERVIGVSSLLISAIL